MEKKLILHFILNKLNKIIKILNKKEEKFNFKKKDKMSTTKERSEKSSVSEKERQWLERHEVERLSSEAKKDEVQPPELRQERLLSINESEHERCEERKQKSRAEIIKSLNEEIGPKFIKICDLKVNKKYSITSYSMYNGVKGAKINIYLNDMFIINLPNKYLKVIKNYEEILLDIVFIVKAFEKNEKGNKYAILEFKYVGEQNCEYIINNLNQENNQNFQRIKLLNLEKNKGYLITNVDKFTTEYGPSILVIINNQYSTFLPKRYVDFLENQYENLIYTTLIITEIKSNGNIKYPILLFEENYCLTMKKSTENLINRLNKTNGYKLQKISDLVINKDY